jgi:hypothetical protein
MVDNALLSEMIATEKQHSLEMGIRRSQVLELARAEARPSGIRTAIAGALTRIAMRIDSAASARAISAR